MGFSSKAEVYKAIIDLDDRVYQMNIEKHNDIENYISAMMAMQQNKSNIISALIMMRAYYAYGQVLEEIEDERSRFKIHVHWLIGLMKIRMVQVGSWEYMIKTFLK